MACRFQWTYFQWHGYIERGLSTTIQLGLPMQWCIFMTLGQINATDVLDDSRGKMCKVGQPNISFVSTRNLFSIDLKFVEVSIVLLCSMELQWQCLGSSYYFQLLKTLSRLKQGVVYPLRQKEPSHVFLWRFRMAVAMKSQRVLECPNHLHGKINYSYKTRWISDGMAPAFIDEVESLTTL